MIYFISGFIIGVSNVVLLFVIDVWFKRKVNPQGFTQAVAVQSREQGVVLEPKSEIVSDFMNSLKDK